MSTAQMHLRQSLGNVIEPAFIIKGGNDKKYVLMRHSLGLAIAESKRKNPRYGVDVLRMWVSSVDYTQDVVIGPMVLCT